MNHLVRPLTATLHRNGGAATGSAFFAPSSTPGNFVFRAPPGTFYLTASDPTDMIPTATRDIELSAREVFKTSITTRCQ